MELLSAVILIVLLSFILIKKQSEGIDRKKAEIPTIQHRN